MMQLRRCVLTSRPRRKKALRGSVAWRTARQCHADSLLLNAPSSGWPLLIGGNLKIFHDLLPVAAVPDGRAPGRKLPLASHQEPNLLSAF